MKIEFEVLSKEQVTESIRAAFAEALRRQGKVKGDLQKKADRCEWLCIAKIDSKVVGVGAIKKKTASDFLQHKANLPELSSDFDWELGYMYTDPDFKGRGIGKSIAKAVVSAFGKGNLMASTEISANPAMVHILESLGFRHYGKPWKSNIHDNYLGLFLRFV